MKNPIMNKTGTLAMKETKKGFTLMEVIFAIIIVGMLAGIIIPKILNNSQRSQIMGTVQSDAKTIINKVVQWKASDPSAQGSYTNLSPQSLANYMPSDMPVTNSRDNKPGDAAIINSSGYGPNLTYLVSGASHNAINVVVRFGYVIPKKDRQKYGQQIANIFSKLSETPPKIDTSKATNQAEVTIDNITP